MNTESEMRKVMARRRQQQTKAQRSMSSRLAAEVKTPTSDADLQSKARKAIAQNRQHEEHIQDSMLSRSEAEINIPSVELEGE